MSERKTEFWWASIHGADPEPVEKTEHDGRPCVYTLGCADPFYLDEQPSAVLLFDPRSNEFTKPEPIRRPFHPDKTLAEKAALGAARAAGRKTYISASGRREPVPHGWRGPR